MLVYQEIVRLRVAPNDVVLMQRIDVLLAFLAPLVALCFRHSSFQELGQWYRLLDMAQKKTHGIRLTVLEPNKAY